MDQADIRTSVTSSDSGGPRAPPARGPSRRYWHVRFKAPLSKAKRLAEDFVVEKRIKD